MNRRDFLKGILGTAAVASLTPTLMVEATPDWTEAIMPIYSDYITNVLLFGTGAIQSVDSFPFIRSIPVSEIYDLQLRTAGDTYVYSDLG